MVRAAAPQVNQRCVCSARGSDRLWKQAPSFNTIFFRNLLALDAVAPDPRYRAMLQSYLDRAWSNACDPATGLFTRGDIGGLAQMYSLLAMSPAQPALVN